MDPKLPVENGPTAPSPLVENELQSPAAVLNSEPARAAVPGKLQTWLHRSSVFLFVLLSAIAGVLLVILPWTPEWTDNYLLLSFPWLRTFFSAGFFRGICSGLGLLDIWIGFWEALHYREHI
jgi:hypothetical protein